jgi:hypothetical protein
MCGEGPDNLFKHFHEKVVLRIAFEKLGSLTKQQEEILERIDRDVCDLIREEVIRKPDSTLPYVMKKTNDILKSYTHELKQNFPEHFYLPYINMVLDLVEMGWNRFSLPSYRV